MDFGDGRGRTLLVLAVESGVSEIVKLVDQFVRGGKLSRNQVGKSRPVLTWEIMSAQAKST